MKRKWWIMAVAALVCVGLTLCIYPVRVRLAPRWMLSRALGSTLDQLERRFAESPVHLLTPALDPEGRQKAHLQLETELDHLGVVRYDMTLQTQRSPNRVLSQGTVVTGGKALELSLYLDGDFAAVSSQGLLDGTFYGITYDSFPGDIRSRELLAMLIGDEILSGWEESVQQLDHNMDLDLSMSELSWEDIRSAVYGLLALKPRVEGAELPLAGEPRRISVLKFHSSGPEICAAAEDFRNHIPETLIPLLDALEQDPDSALDAAIYLHDGQVVRLEAALKLENEEYEGVLDFGAVPLTDTLTVSLNTCKGEDLTRTVLSLDTVSDAERYDEQLNLTVTRNSVQTKTSAHYVWDLSTGEMDLELTTGKGSATVRLNLAGELDSLTIITQDASPLANLFLEKPWKAPAICTLRIAPGECVQTPEYRNLSEWSLEDLFALLSGLGGLLGLKLP